MKKTMHDDIKINLSVMARPLKEQLAEQGYKLHPVIFSRMEALNKARLLLTSAGCLTINQSSSAKLKITKLIIKELAPLELKGERPHE